MSTRPTTAAIIKQIAESGHDADMCLLVEEMSKDVSRDAGKTLGGKITSIIDRRYAEH